jgi:hypothetical protein
MAAEPKAANPRWKEIVDRYQQPAVRRALWQVANTLVPYSALWYLMHLSLAVSYWLTAALAVLAGGFLVHPSRPNRRRPVRPPPSPKQTGRLSWNQTSTRPWCPLKPSPQRPTFQLVPWASLLTSTVSRES